MPLYYAMRGSSCIFGSEVKALLAHPLVDPQPDMAAIQAYLSLQQFETATPFARIQAPPGHILRIGPGGTGCFPDADLLDSIDPDRLAAPAEPVDGWLAELEETLQASVADHLAADVPVAVLRSGGLDSSYLAVLAHERQPTVG